ncbi:hypothetical protein H5410_020860 [Solanum commersonii]|uniref:Uncharacterized protein n=1 Tax=Solanum commersonii TaxID=4109 RepID=A0A9J5Z994_SOLCO|nr:hypothetical protein H5410_020860 [Solanum commersonii]
MSCKGELTLETSLKSEYPYECIMLCLVLGIEAGRRTSGRSFLLGKERNGRHFEGTNSSIEKIRMNCLRLLFFGVNRIYGGEVGELVY